jgi:hypothetical protein
VDTKKDEMQNEEPQKTSGNDAWSFLKSTFTFFGDVLAAVKADRVSTLLWGFGVLLFVFLVVILALGNDLPPTGKVTAVILTILILPVLFIFTITRIDKLNITKTENENVINLTGKWFHSYYGEQLYSANLTQEDNRVKGEYTVPDPENPRTTKRGTIDGRIEGNIFKFHWQQPFHQRHGEAELDITADGRMMIGTWNYDPTCCLELTQRSGPWIFRKSN